MTEMSVAVYCHAWQVDDDTVCNAHVLKADDTEDPRGNETVNVTFGACWLGMTIEQAKHLRKQLDRAIIRAQGNRELNGIEAERLEHLNQQCLRDDAVYERQSGKDD